MKETILYIWDAFCDWIYDWGILFLILLIATSLLVYAEYRQDVEKEKCKTNGGVVIEHFYGYTCLTEKDFKKIRGD